MTSAPCSASSLPIVGTADEMREMENTKPFQRPKRGWLEGDLRTVGELGKFDRQHARQRLALGVHTPFLRVALDGGRTGRGRRVRPRALGHRAAPRVWRLLRGYSGNP